MWNVCTEVQWYSVDLRLKAEELDVVKPLSWKIEYVRLTSMSEPIHNNIISKVNTNRHIWLLGFRLSD